ncbi:MAG: hypothetical protein Q9227_000354 [Pyrenula ochraceoflavens]
MAEEYDSYICNEPGPVQDSTSVLNPTYRLYRSTVFTGTITTRIPKRTFTFQTTVDYKDGLPAAKRQCRSVEKSHNDTSHRLSPSRLDLFSEDRLSGAVAAAVEGEGLENIFVDRSTFSGTGSDNGVSLMAASRAQNRGTEKSSKGNAATSASTSASLDLAGIGELLDQEEKPTFIIDLKDNANYTPGPLRLFFVNDALKRRPDMLDLVQGGSEISSHAVGTVSSYAEFKAWATSFVKDFEALSVSLPSFSYGDAVWMCSATLRKRLRVLKAQIDGHQTTSIAMTREISPRSPQVVDEQTDSGVTGFVPLDNDAAGLASRSIDTKSLKKGPPKKGPSGRKHLETRIDAMALRRERISKKEAPLSPSQLLSHRNAGLNEYFLNEAILRAASAGNVDAFGRGLPNNQSTGFFDWTRLPFSKSLPRHIQFARSVDWASTPLGPIEDWEGPLRQMALMIFSSPHPAAMYWGEDLTAIYNESYIMLAGQKHPTLMGMSYRDAWSEIWDAVKDVFANALSNAQATMKDDDQLFIKRADFLEETYFSWSIIPLIGEDGSVVGLYNPAFEKTRRKIAERRMLTLREVGETTAVARDLSDFWSQIVRGLQLNEYDAPFVLVYSISDESDSSEVSSVGSSSFLGAKQCVLQGNLGIPDGHQAAPAQIDLKTGEAGFTAGFRNSMRTDRPIFLQEADGTLDPNLLDGITWRGFGDRCRSCVICPIHPTTGESTLGFLVMGTNPRRPYDEDYELFVQLLGRQLATSVASVVLYEEEIKRSQRAARLAAQDRIELSNQLAVRTQEAEDLENKFSRMAELAPVGMFIADYSGRLIFCNKTWYDLSRYPHSGVVENDWMELVNEVDRPILAKSWSTLIEKRSPISLEFRFKTPWQDPKGNTGDTWVLMSAYPEKTQDGQLKSAFGSVTDISSQKFAEDFNKRRMEEAVELKRQQQNYIDTTSHEIRNPLSAILQCADEVSSTLEEVKASQNMQDHLVDTVDSALDAAQTITLCAQHQKRIVDDVLTLSKLDSAMLMVTPVDVQPVSVIQRALKMFEGELQNADIELEFKVDKSVNDLGMEWVRVDPSRLLQILINLVTNAIKFTTGQEKRQISVQLAAYLQRPSEITDNQISYVPTRSTGKDITVDADWGTGEKIFLYFAISDTGRGLTESEKKLLFLRFSQGSPRTHVAYGGSGLGLFISRELVEMHGGEIGVFSQRGKGSTFAFYVTAKRSQAPKDWEETQSNASISSRKGSGTKILRSLAKNQHDDSSKSPPAIAGKRSASTSASAVVASPPPMSPSDASPEALRIFIVEDNVVNQKVLSKQLTKVGCIIQVANHGGEAIERLRQSKYWKGRQQDGEDLGLILMDIEMPVMDGLTAARKIRELEREGELVSHVPIMAVTANAREEQITIAMDAGMVR